MDALNRTFPQAHWFLRLALASVFLVKGWPKLTGPGPLLGLDPWVVFLVGLAEFGGALLILIGGFSKDWLTRLGALALIPPIVGAIAIAHWGRWSFVTTWSPEGPGTHPMGGMEFQVTLLLIQLYLLFKGNTA